MPTPYHTIKRKIEDACAAVIASLKGTTLATRTVFKGASFDALVIDRIEIVASKAEQEILADGLTTGNYNVTLVVAVVSHKDDKTRAEHTTDCGDLCDILMRDDMATQFNAAGVTNLTVFNPGFWLLSEEDLINDAELRTEYECRVYCKPS